MVGPLHKFRDWDKPSPIHHDLTHLPPPPGKIVAAVYGFRDQTGQYKPPPSSSFSTAVTQGASSMLIMALANSGWFIPVEREGLQNILTERKIIRAKIKNRQPNAELNPLLGANIIIEGGIIAYDTDIRTGGLGAKYFGIGSSEQYRVDQITVGLRAVDIYSGKIINAVSVTKSILSIQVSFGVFRFVKFKRLLEIETGFTRNEPAQVVVLDAIESAVIRMIVTGIHKQNWGLADPEDLSNPIIQAYSNDHWLSESPNLLVPVQQQQNPAPQQRAIENTSQKTNGPATQNTNKQPPPAPQSPAAQKKTTPPAPPSSNKPQQQPQPQLQPPAGEQHNRSETANSKQRIRFYTIQLVASSNRQAIAPFITRNGLNINQINYLEFVKDGKTWHAATYGKFTSKQAAQQALDTLSPQLRVYKPWIRTIENLELL